MRAKGEDNGAQQKHQEGHGHGREIAMWVSLNVRITPEQDAHLSSVCKTTGESRSDVIRRLITAESYRLEDGDRTCKTSDL